MIYDCFLFNTELELLKLRLSFLDDVVDFFVIVESKRTLSGNDKILYYKENEEKFQDYNKKIIHLEAPARPDLESWEYEYFQRNYLKEGLRKCNDNDIILISDLDEIVNLKRILSFPKLILPCLIELPYYYYFFNLKSHGTFKVNLLAEYSFIKNLYVGERNNTYKKYVSNVIRTQDCKTGWHFSYLFGFDILKYQEKIQSFSHQEFNNPYFLNPNRIQNCISLGVDLFERKNIFFYFTNNNDLAEIMIHIKFWKLDYLIYKPPIRLFLKGDKFVFYFNKKFKPLMFNNLYYRPKNAITKLTLPFRSKIRRILIKFKK